MALSRWLLCGAVLIVQRAVALPTALIIVDVQNCFLINGTLPVAGGIAVVPVINNIITTYGKSLHMIVHTQDWHCANHVSFASQHAGYQPFQQIQLPYNAQGQLCISPGVNSTFAVNCGVGQATVTLTQTLWPDHCIINTTDAALYPDIIMQPSDIVIQKGWRCQVDSYSAFLDNGGFTSTPLNAVLQAAGIKRLIITGLATDYCDYYTAMDGIRYGYQVYFVLDATVGIALDTVMNAMEQMVQAGVHLITSSMLGNVLADSVTL
jgi:nicotinamidase/pyrazinamidase